MPCRNCACQKSGIWQRNKLTACSSRRAKAMKFTTIRKAIPAALTLVCVGGLSSNANASAYAISYDNVFDLAITSTNSSGGGGPFYVPLSDFNSFSATSSTTAFLNSNPGLPSSQTAGGPVDAQVAVGQGSTFVGGAPLNNAM